MRAVLVAAAMLFAGCTIKSPTPALSTAPPPRPAPTTQVPGQVPDPVIQIAAHAEHTCALRRSGTVLCWGKNTYGQLGDGRRQDNPRVSKVVGLADAIRVEVGRDFSCALRRGGTVVCWGNNEDGQLGDGKGDKPGVLSLRPVAVRQLQNIRQISLGEYHGCALDQRGVLRCWGNTANGQLGSDQRRAFPLPIVIERLSEVRAVASGANHVCALEARGTVQCWGRNTEGQLGDGKSGSRIKPVQVAGLEDAVALSSGHNHTCALRRTGVLMCWGDNVSRQLGPAAGNDRKRDTPVAVPGLSGLAEIAGGGRHTCARLQNGRAVCWGANEHGQLGHVAAPSHRAQPTPVRGVSDAVDLALGANHSCAVRRTGEVACWGATDHGALGPHRLARLDLQRG